MMFMKFFFYGQQKLISSFLKARNENINFKCYVMLCTDNCLCRVYYFSPEKKRVEVYDIRE